MFDRIMHPHINRRFYESGTPNPDRFLYFPYTDDGDYCLCFVIGPGLPCVQRMHWGELQQTELTHAVRDRVPWPLRNTVLESTYHNTAKPPESSLEPSSLPTSGTGHPSFPEGFLSDPVAPTWVTQCRVCGGKGYWFDADEGIRVDCPCGGK